MKKDLVIKATDFSSSFLSCEKDTETILKKLFVESRPYSDELKRLLVINTKDCLDNKESEVYKRKIADMSLPHLIEEGYIRTYPRMEMHEHEEIKTVMIIQMDDFTPNFENPHFRDCTICITVLSHPEYWDLGNYRLRPLKAVGYIDGILNKARLSGIGTLNFYGCSRQIQDENWMGYTLIYRAIHGNDDKLVGELNAG